MQYASIGFTILLAISAIFFMFSEYLGDVSDEDIEKNKKYPI